MNSITPPPTEALAHVVVQGLEAVKAQDIVSLVSDHFYINGHPDDNAISLEFSPR